MNKILKTRFISICFLVGLASLSLSLNVTAASPVALNDVVQLGTYTNLAVNEYVDINDYMIEDYVISTAMGEYIYASTGQDDAGSGTSYIDLSESNIYGDYASEAQGELEYVFLETTPGAVTESNATLTQTAPAVSASDTDCYITSQVDFTTQYNDADTGTEYAYWDFDVDVDLNDDGDTDDAQEDYVPLTQNVFLYVVAKLSSSDVDAVTMGSIYFSFYTGATNYDLQIQFRGGNDTAAYTSRQFANDANSGILTFYETEDQWVVALVDVASFISSDTDSAPAISGIDYWRMYTQAGDNYGDGTADTVDFTVRNVAILNSAPAFKDRSPSTTFDYYPSTTVVGDANYYNSHDIFVPYTPAAATNAWNTYIYLDDDFKSGDSTLTEFRLIKFEGTARLDPSIVDIETELGAGPNRRDVSLSFNFNQLRIFDDDSISSSYQPSYSTCVFNIMTDKDDFYSDALSFDDDIIEASVGGVDETEDFKTALSNIADSTEVTLYTWGTVPTTGIQPIDYSYWSAESGNPEDDSETSVGDWFSDLWTDTVTVVTSQNFLLVGGVSLVLIIGVAVWYTQFKKKKRN